MNKYKTVLKVVSKERHTKHFGKYEKKFYPEVKAKIPENLYIRTIFHGISSSRTFPPKMDGHYRFGSHPLQFLRSPTSKH